MNRKITHVYWRARHLLGKNNPPCNATLLHRMPCGQLWDSGEKCELELGHLGRHCLMGVPWTEDE